MMKFHGIPAAPGYALGSAFVYREPETKGGRAHPAGPIQAEVEHARLAEAVALSEAQLTELESQVRAKVGESESAIFNGHLAFLRDPEIVGEAFARIDSGGKRAEAAVREVIEATASLFDEMDEDPLLRERASDIRDVGKRLMSALKAGGRDPWDSLPDGCVVVARDLSPSDTARLDPDKVLAFAIDEGGPTSHSAILAKAMGIAAIVGLGDVSSKIDSGARLIVDGMSGTLIVDPDDETRSEYERKLREWRSERERAKELAQGETYTREGKRVLVAANIGSLAEARRAVDGGAEGIGLFRTEFLYMDRDQPPSENEQFEIYRDVLEAMGGRPVIIRTLDIGGDKDVPYLGLPKEANPFLGLRAIRLCLQRPDLFKAQLRAVVRAAGYGDLRVMFPMIDSVERMKQARAVLSECVDELEAEGQKPRRDIPVGAMIEIPSAAILADELALECDFFSIGSNDLTQYTLAVDRMSSSIAELYDPFHPAVLFLIKRTIEAARAAGIHCGMCGELAGDPKAIPLLLDYGLDEFSMNPASIPGAKAIIRKG